MQADAVAEARRERHRGKKKTKMQTKAFENERKVNEEKSFEYEMHSRYYIV